MRFLRLLFTLLRGISSLRNTQATCPYDPKLVRQAHLLHTYAYKELGVVPKERLLRHYETYYWQLFFRYFPSTWETFNQIYNEDKALRCCAIGYDYPLDKVLDGLLSRVLSKKISAWVYYTKMTSVGINSLGAKGHHKAVLQAHVHKLIPQDLALSARVLSVKTENEIFCFWHFFYEGLSPVRSQELYQAIYTPLKQLQPTMATFMQHAYQALQPQS